MAKWRKILCIKQNGFVHQTKKNDRIAIVEKDKRRKRKSREKEIHNIMIENIVSSGLKKLRGWMSVHEKVLKK